MVGRRGQRPVALALVLALLVAACGSAADSSRQQSVAVEQNEVSQPEGAADFLTEAPELVIGVVLPETGSLSFLYPPENAGVHLGVEDVRAGGGRVEIVAGDSGTDPDLAVETVNRLLGEGAHAIIGAAASGVSQGIIQTLYESQIAQCAASNTSAAFSTQENAEFFFRTVTTTRADAPVMADNIARSGGTKVAILARGDDWGKSLSEQLTKSLEELNVASEVVVFSQDAVNFQDTAESVGTMGADTVVILAFAEGAQIVRSLLEAGVPPIAMHGGAGMFDVELPSIVSPGSPELLDGFTVYAASGSVAFNERLSEVVGGNVVFGGQAYDCVIVLALASLAAGSTDGPDILAEVQNVTRDGTKCFGYGECAALLAQGVDIDYDGVSGPLDLDEVGDISVGRFGIAQVRNGVLEVLRVQDIDVD